MVENPFAIQTYAVSSLVELPAMTAGNMGQILNISSYFNIPSGYHIGSVIIDSITNAGYAYQLVPFYYRNTDTLNIRCFYTLPANAVSANFGAVLVKD